MMVEVECQLMGRVERRRQEERLEKRWKTELEKEDQWVRLRKNRARRTGTGEGPAR